MKILQEEGVLGSFISPELRLKNRLKCDRFVTGVLSTSQRSEDMPCLKNLACFKCWTVHFALFDFELYFPRAQAVFLLKSLHV